MYDYIEILMTKVTYNYVSYASMTWFGHFKSQNVLVMDVTFWHSDVSCGVDIFILVIKFFSETCVPAHISMGLFESTKQLRNP